MIKVEATSHPILSWCRFSLMCHYWSNHCHHYFTHHYNIYYTVVELLKVILTGIESLQNIAIFFLQGSVIYLWTVLVYAPLIVAHYEQFRFVPANRWERKRERERERESLFHCVVHRKLTVVAAFSKRYADATPYLITSHCLLFRHNRHR
jgi:hypothetical protein